MDDKSDVKNIRIIWGDTKEMDYKYANNLFVSHAGNGEFHLVFGHLIPLNNTGLTKDEVPDQVEVKPVSCLVVSKENMKAFIDVLQQNYNLLDKAHKNDNT